MTARRFGVRFNGSALEFVRLDCPDTAPQVAAPPTPEGAWHHVAATYDGANIRLYVDGRLSA